MANTAATARAGGVYAITRNPMWSFAIRSVCHVLAYPNAKTIILSGAIILVALIGAARDLGA